MLSERLRNSKEDAGQVFEENRELIQDLYVQCLGASLDIEEDKEESFIIICTMMASCMLMDLQKIPNPFEIDYEEEDFDLIANVASAVAHYLVCEKLCEKGLAKKKIVNRAPVYTIPKKVRDKMIPDIFRQ